MLRHNLFLWWYMNYIEHFEDIFSMLDDGETFRISGDLVSEHVFMKELKSGHSCSLRVNYYNRKSGYIFSLSIMDSSSLEYSTHHGFLSHDPEEFKKDIQDILRISEYGYQFNNIISYFMSQYKLDDDSITVPLYTYTPEQLEYIGLIHDGECKLVRQLKEINDAQTDRSLVFKVDDTLLKLCKVILGRTYD